jgi:hypothetical protein
MGLVDYSDSEADEEENEGREAAPPAKRRRVSGVTSNLPPLPQAFRDLYSSTVRTSTQDDPSLHGGRKRVIPHVPGSWPTHIYLECKLLLPTLFRDTSMYLSSAPRCEPRSLTLPRVSFA